MPTTQAALWDSIRRSEDLTIVVGLGGKPGSNSLRVIARLGHEVGTFVRMVATMPFPFEGKARLHRAEEGLRGLGLYVNESIIFNNDYAIGRRWTKRWSFWIFRKWNERPMYCWSK